MFCALQTTCLTPIFAVIGVKHAEWAIFTAWMISLALVLIEPHSAPGSDGLSLHLAQVLRVMCRLVSFENMISSLLEYLVTVHT